MSAVLAPALPEAVPTQRMESDPLLFKRARTWWLIVVLLLIAGQNSWFTEAVPQGTELMHIKQGYYESSLALRLMTLSVYVITFSLVLGRLRDIFRSLLHQPLFLAFLGLAVASTLWSQSPIDTLRRIPLLFCLIALGWYVGLYYESEDQIRLTLIVGLVLASFSAILALGVPRFGLDTAGEWKGVMGTKNQFGHAMLFLFSGVLFRRGNGKRLLWLVSGLLGLTCLFMTRSAESLALAMLITAIRFCGPLYQRTPSAKRPFPVFLAATAVLLAVIGRVTLLDLFGKDTTLTGRTDEWAALLPYAFKHVLLGYGYQAFWTGSGDSLQVMREVGGWMHGADSGYLDLLLQFGLLGLGLALWILVGSARRALQLLKTAQRPNHIYWYLSLVCVSLVGNLTDAYFPLTGGAPEVTLIFACVSIWKSSRSSSQLQSAHGTNVEQTQWGATATQRVAIRRVETKLHVFEN